MRFYGSDDQGKRRESEFNIVAKHGDGLYIPSMPAILMAKKLVSGEIAETGAVPCVGFITLDEYLEALGEYNISWDTA